MTFIELKVCRDCGLSKPLSEFYIDGRRGRHINSCKECKRAYERRPERSEYERKRYKVPERRAYSLANSKHWVRLNDDGYRAHNAANNAVRDGKLKRKPCQQCGSAEYVHKHHPDYSKPLEVVWLCARCHARTTHGTTIA